MPDTHFDALRAAKAKAAKPDFFDFDALTASEADCNARLAAVTHAARPPLAPKAGFDAMTATDREFEDELRRLGVRTPTFGAGPHRFRGSP